MLRIFRQALFFISILSSTIIFAQDTKPVHFNFEAKRISDKQAIISISAKVASGTQLFSIKKQQADDAFITSIAFDSASSILLKDSLNEEGNVQTHLDTTAGTNVQFFTDSVRWTQNLELANGDSTLVKGIITWLAKVADSYESGEETFKIKVPAASTTAITANNATTASTETSTSSIFWICLVTGLLAVLTPCVFPLIPVTVSFFLKRSKSRAQGLTNAVWYSLSIILNLYHTNSFTYFGFW